MSTETEPEVHPVQVGKRHERGWAPTCVTLRAYEVYCRLYGPQRELITGSCRGGFGTNELVAFLYARSFPQEEWQQRVDEAFEGMRGL